MNYKCISVFLCMAVALLLTESCGKNAGGMDRKEMVSSATDTIFHLPEVPVMLTEPALRDAYLAEHWWDAYIPGDVSFLKRSAQTEQAWARYAMLLHGVPKDVSLPAIRKLMHSAETDTALLRRFSALAEKYLYDPNFPYHSEDLYMAVLETVSGSHALSDAEKIRPRWLLGMVRKNRPGMRAADFRYTLADGKQETLLGTKAEYTLLYFNNPGCHACGIFTEKLRRSLVLNEMLKGDRLKILSVYPDEDMDEWYRHREDMPEEWLVSYDKGGKIRRDESYNLHAIPTLYLLDADKRIILKDAVVEEVERYLYKRQLVTMRRTCSDE